jgi:hypothetical protein
MRTRISLLLSLAVMSLSASAAIAAPFFSTGDPNGLMATATRPTNGGKIETETGDDFVLNTATKITGATFTGLLTGDVGLADIGNVVVEIYRVFPKDSQNPPSGNVPTRVNSPSDVASDSRNAAGATLAFTASILSTDFTANNSVINGINPQPNQKTGGEGAVNGLEVLFTIDFGSNPFSLPADHYFFVPQVDVNGGEFLWLSAPKPIVTPGTPFLPDLQAWIRNENLAPDWLRIGTDIVGTGPAGEPAPTFNAAFSLSGDPIIAQVPEPSSLALALGGLVLLYRQARKPR